MGVLGIQGVHRSFGIRSVLDDVSLSIEARERVGVVGRNGSGKTTLGRIVAGEDQPDAGVVTRNRDVSLGYLPQVPKLEHDLTAHDVVVGGMKRWLDAKRSYDEATDALGHNSGDSEPWLMRQTEAAADIERLGGWQREHEALAMLNAVGVANVHKQVGQLSGGEQRRVALARLLVARPDVAVLDEPTNHLDIETIEWLERYLCNEFSGAIFLVTHDRYLLDRVVSRTIEIEAGRLYSYVGGYETYLEAKQRRLEHDRRTEQNRQNDLRRELQWLRRQPKARTGKSRARVQRVEALADQEGPPGERNVVLAPVAVTRAGRTMIETEDVRVAYGDTCLVRDFSLRVTQGERIAIVGPNAVGKTTLLRTLVGDFEPVSGTVRRGKNTRIAYLDQVRSGLDDAATVFDAVAAGRSQIAGTGETIDVRVWLERFLFDGAASRQRVGQLSGGERARVALAKLLSEPGNVLVLDEPTNDLDVSTLGALEGLLLEYEGACLVVTHDRWFLDRVATAIWVFEGDGVVARHEGGWQDYLARRVPSVTPVASSAVASPEVRTPKRRSVKLTYAERLELDAIEVEIDTAERKVTGLETQLAAPETYAEGPDLGREVAAALAEAKAALEIRYERWQVLESKRAAQ